MNSILKTSFLFFKTNWLQTLCLITLLFLNSFYGLAQKPQDVDSLLNELKTNLSDKERSNLLMDLASLYAGIDSTQFMTYIQQALDIADATGDKELKIDVTDLIGLSHSIRGKQAAAEIEYRKAWEESIELKYVKGEARAYARIATTYLFRGYIDTAGVLYNRAIEDQKILDDRQGLGYSYNGLATYNIFIGDFDNALDLYNQALVYRTELKDRKGQISTYTGMAIAYANQTRYLAALDYNFKAMELIEKEGNKRSLANVMNNIGSIYNSRLEYEKTLEYYGKSLPIYKELNDSTRIALSYKNMGYTTLLTGAAEKAVEYLELSLNIYELLGDDVGKASTLVSLGSAYSEIEEFEKALLAHDESLEIRRKLGSKKSINISLTSSGFLHLKMGNINRAVEAMEESLELALELGSLDELERVHRLISQVEKVRGNYERAFDSYILYKKYNDTIQGNLNSRRIARLEADFEFQKEKDSLTFAQEKIQLGLEQEINRRKTINQASIGAGLLVLIILILLYRSYLIKQKRNKELREKNVIIENKNDELLTKNGEINALRETEKKMAEETLSLKERELTTVTMLSHEKNSLLQQLGEQIGSLTEKVDEKVIPDLREIKRMIKSNLSEESWSMFMYQFEKVHPAFFSSLKDKHPGLTQHDLRLCAYIKVGMDNKEIAQVSNITPAGVKKSINRLKKKLELDPDMALREFLMSI